MSMSQSRYEFLRNRANELFNILNHRGYEVWIAPRTTMSIEQLRDRYELKREGFANDTDFFSTPQKRIMKVPQLIDILPNISSLSKSEIGFGRPNYAVVEIYETIQEYIALWCEFLNNAPEFGSPPRSELRLLEGLAFYLFPLYKEIKPFRQKQDVIQQMRDERAVNKVGLMGLSMLFNYSGVDDDFSFVSHLDALEGKNHHSDPDMGNGYIPTPPRGLTDGLGSLPMADTTTEWIFKG